MELRLNSSFADINIRAKSPTAGIKAEIVAIFILKPEAFRHRVISLISKTATPPWSEFLASSLSHMRHIEANGDLFLSHPQTQNRPPSSSTNALSFSSACTSGDCRAAKAN